MTEAVRPARLAVEFLLCLALVTTISWLVVARDDDHPPAPSPSPAPAPVARPNAPNIVLVTTDDQTLADLRWMPRTRRILGGHGVTFSHALSPAPLCCPARAEIITGQLGQNNGVQFNRGPYGGYHVLREKKNTIGTWLQAAGYHTALVGKFLNRWNWEGRPTGWTIWRGAVHGIYSYGDTAFATDTGTRTFTRNVTPVISGYTARFVRRLAADDAPFFIWASHVAPHLRRANHSATVGLPLPTARYQHVLRGVRSPSLSKPSFDVAGRRPRPYPHRMRHPLPRGPLQEEFTRRIQSLQDVDAAVARLVSVLRETHQLANTYILFTSDNAFLLGEHRLTGKNILFREALEVPLVVRVPGARHGRTSSLPVTLTDLAPTILDLAGGTAGRPQDGRSFATVLRGYRPGSWRDTQLVQAGNHRRRGPEPGWDFRGVRTRRYTYMLRIDDQRAFLYDRRTDPHEMVDVARDLRYRPVLRELARRYAALAQCAGADCGRRFGPVPQPRSPRAQGVSPATSPASPRGTPRP
ncbi:sulfatase family protein [Nocardioides sp. MAHUQ-72]|uniref:sulfatase family protein n=1 Tax=unclassified Nocardioides TaxID=2615069 RepID=UPI0036087216